MTEKPWIPKVGERVFCPSKVSSEIYRGSITFEVFTEIREYEAHELRPADEPKPSVDEMLRVVLGSGASVSIEMLGSGETCIAFPPSAVAGNTCVFEDYEPTAAITAAYDAITKEEPTTPWDDVDLKVEDLAHALLASLKQTTEGLSDEAPAAEPGTDEEQNAVTKEQNDA